MPKTVLDHFDEEMPKKPIWKRILSRKDVKWFGGYGVLVHFVLAFYSSEEFYGVIIDNRLIGWKYDFLAVFLIGVILGLTFLAMVFYGDLTNNSAEVLSVGYGVLTIVGFLPVVRELSQIMMYFQEQLYHHQLAFFIVCTLPFLCWTIFLGNLYWFLVNRFVLKKKSD
ncbi:MAG: hypothetical protein GY810_13735 [Aureispira sp.]|nr:hypothetical protein [Aureispira sp.]